MIDLIPLKDFLASIAPVSRTNYQIRGRNGEMVFSTKGVMPEKLSVEEFQHLTSKVIEQKAFRYTSRDGCDFLCGIPIRNGQGVFGALLAFGRIPDRSTLYDAEQDAKASHTREMENFLGHLISLLEDNLNAKEEISLKSFPSEETPFNPDFLTSSSNSFKTIYTLFIKIWSRTR